MSARERLEYLRGELRAERISWGELAELQSLAGSIDPEDVELLEAAGVPEHPWETSEQWGTEVVIRTENGMQLRADGEDETGTSYVRVCDANGEEIAYWNRDEWQEEPEFVMGAIIGALVAPEKERTA